MAVSFLPLLVKKLPGTLVSDGNIGKGTGRVKMILTLSQAGS